MGSKTKNPPQKLFVLLTLQMEISPHTASAFTDNLDLQLYVVCDVSLMPVAEVTPTHAQPGTMEQWDHVPVLTAATPKGNNHHHHLLQCWLLPPGMEHTSCLCSHWAALPTQLLLKWESPECTKPPKKPQKIQAPTCQAVSSHCFTPARQLRNCHGVTEQPR